MISWVRSHSPRLLWATLAALSIAGLANPAHACGPFFPDKALFNANQPDDPTAFLAGEVQIFERTYAPRWRFAAWRQFSGRPLTASEQVAILPLPADYSGTRAREAWNKARTQAGAKPEWISGDKWMEIPQVGESGEATTVSYGFTNCHDDAFQVAAETLEARLALYGQGSPVVADWLANQEAVFSNCSERGGLPVELGAWAPAALRADRAYQFAAAYFYRGDFDQAAQRFLAISQDAESSWHGIALYLAARSYARKAALLEGLKTPLDPAAGEEAKKLARRVLADPTRSRWHAATRTLLDSLEARLNPKKRLDDVASALSRPRQGKTDEDLQGIRSDLTDLLYLRDLGIVADSKNDLGEWLDLVWTEGDPTGVEVRAAATKALERWRERKSSVWLIAALALAAPDSDAASELVTAAQKIPEKDPAYWTATYHRLRLTLRGDPRSIRPEIGRILAKNGKRFGPSAEFRLRSLRAESAENLSEFLADASGPLTYDWQSDSTDRVFSPLAEEQLNLYLPLSRLVEAAESPTLDARLRSEVAALAWTRAVLLNRTGDSKLALRAAAVLATADPTFRSWKPSGTSLRGLETVHLLLNHPGFEVHLRELPLRNTPFDEIDSFRLNWWCSVSPFEASSEAMSPPKWLSETDRAERAAEVAALGEIAAAPTFLGRAAIAAIEQNPQHALAAETLYLVVRATRYGCSDDENGVVSKQAFTLLHRRYPTSEWATKTPYWYD